MQKLPASAQVVRSRWTPAPAFDHRLGTPPQRKRGKGGEGPRICSRTRPRVTLVTPPPSPASLWHQQDFPGSRSSCGADAVCRMSSAQEEGAHASPPELPPFPFPFPFPCFPFSLPHSRIPGSAGAPNLLCFTPGRAGPCQPKHGREAERAQVGKDAPGRGF